MPQRERDDDRMDRDGRDHDRDRDRRRRSRSRDRGDRNDRDRGDRDRRERRRSRSRSHSRSPSRRRRGDSPSHTNTTGPSGRHEEVPMSKMTEDERMMKEVMGFGSFHTTKGKKVDGNNVGGVHVIMKRKYRQYMNRKGGFNRPLDFVA